METTESLQLNLKTDNQVADNVNANKKRHFDTDQEPVTENENDETIKYKRKKFPNFHLDYTNKYNEGGFNRSDWFSQIIQWKK